MAAQKAALKRIETFIPVGSASAARGTAGPIKVVEVPRGGPLAFANKLAVAFENVTGYGNVVDYMLDTYGFTKTWQLFMSADGKRSDSRTAFLNEEIVTKATQSQLNGIDGRLLQVLTGSYVTKINFDTTSGVEPIATGVSFVRNGVPHIAVARKAVVDASGWFSPHLLQVSGLGDPAGARRGWHPARKEQRPHWSPLQEPPRPQLDLLQAQWRCRYRSLQRQLYLHCWCLLPEPR